MLTGFNNFCVKYDGTYYLSYLSVTANLATKNSWDKVDLPKFFQIAVEPNFRITQLQFYSKFWLNTHPACWLDSKDILGKLQ